MTSTTDVKAISIVLGAVRIATALNWAEATDMMRTQVTAKYSGIYYGSQGEILRRRLADELGQVNAGPKAGNMLCVGGPWTWGTDIRYAVPGESGLTAGDLCVIKDEPNGRYGGWTVRVKAKILRVDITGGTARVTVRITDRSATQFRAGEITTVGAGKIFPRRKSER